MFMKGMPLYIFWGANSFSLREALQELRSRLDEDGHLWANTVVLDGRRLRPQDLMEACDAAPFLGRHRLVVVEGLLARFQTEGGRQPSLGSWEALPEYVRRMPPYTHLVLVEQEIAPQNPLWRALQPWAQKRHFSPLEGEELLQWLAQRSRRLGLRLTQKAARLLMELLGHDLWALASELEKLAVFARGETVKEAQVRELVSAARAVGVFQLVDAVGEGRALEAVALLHRLLAQGEEPLHLLALLQAHYRRLLLARELLAQGAGLELLAQELRLPRRVLTRVVAQARAHSFPRLRAIYRRLVETDAAIKRGRMSGEMALEALIFQLASPGAITGVGG
jgi:DNA polymerase-3 subunit delta